MSMCEKEIIQWEEWAVFQTPCMVLCILCISTTVFCFFFFTKSNLQLLDIMCFDFTLSLISYSTFGWYNNDA